MYKKILYADISQKEMDYFQSLNDQLNKWESALDDIIYSDVLQQCNDDKYFIF